MIVGEKGVSPGLSERQVCCFERGLAKLLPAQRAVKALNKSLVILAIRAGDDVLPGVLVNNFQKLGLEFRAAVGLQGLNGAEASGQFLKGCLSATDTLSLDPVPPRGQSPQRQSLAFSMRTPLESVLYCPSALRDSVAGFVSTTLSRSRIFIENTTESSRRAGTALARLCLYPYLVAMLPEMITIVGELPAPVYLLRRSSR